MNISLIKIISILSCLLGVMCGFISLLPYIGGFSFFVLMCLSSVIIMLLLIRTKILNVESVAESLTIGGIIGFIAYIAFSLAYLPLVILLAKGFNYTMNYGVTLFVQQANLFIIITFTLFIAVVSATINAGTGFAVYYINELLKNIGKNNGGNDGRI